MSGLIITSLAILIVLAVVLKPLRNGFFALHIALVVGAAWLIENHYAGAVTQFTQKAFVIFLALHLAIVNLVTFFVYFYDKRAARRQQWRVPENTLHAFAFIGGTPAAHLAQKILRHKTKKWSFMALFWVIFIMQAAALAIMILAKQG